MVELGLLVLVENLERQELLVLVENLERQELQELLDLQALMVRLVFRDLLESQE